MLFLWLAPVTHAANQVNLYLFWGDGCPHCAKEKTFLTNILPKYPEAELNTYEIYHNQNNVGLMQKTADKLNANASGVPFLIIGDKYFVGFSEGVTDKEIESRIKQCSSSNCPDSIGSIVNSTVSGDSYPTATSQPQDEQQTDKKVKIVKLPFVGEINTLNYSLPLLTIIIGTLDGFNPCAMWTLLFLISLLLGLKSRRRMWLLGGTFIAASAFVYFLFMAAWLQLILFLGFIVWVRIAIGALAIAGGGYNVRDYLKKRKESGCKVTGSEKRQRTFAKMKAIAQQNSLWLALGGIILLAFAVNLVELVCSAGFPAIFTQVLALSDLATWQYYGYILLYIFFFMLDDMIIFAIAMLTLRATGISTKYSKISSLVGGILMIIIGLLLILKPELLMFG